MEERRTEATKVIFFCLWVKSPENILDVGKVVERLKYLIAVYVTHLKIIDTYVPVN